MGQALAAMMINGRCSVLLAQEEITLLNERLRRCPSIAAEVEKAACAVCWPGSFSQTAAYFLASVPQFTAKFTMFADQGI